MGATDPEPRALSSPLRPPSPISAEPRGMSGCHALEDCSLANTLPPLHSQSPLCSLVPHNIIKFALGSSILKNSRCHPVLSATSPGFFPCADFSGADFTGCLLSFTSHLGPISAPSLAQLVEVTYLHVWTQGHSWSSSLVLLCALGRLPGPASAAPSPHLLQRHLPTFLLSEYSNSALGVPECSELGPRFSLLLMLSIQI